MAVMQKYLGSRIGGIWWSILSRCKLREEWDNFLDSTLDSWLYIEQTRGISHTWSFQKSSAEPIEDCIPNNTAAAAAKSLQLCPTLCDPIESPVPGILQARTLEWVAISFSNAWKWKVKRKSLSHVRLFWLWLNNLPRAWPRVDA